MPNLEPDATGREPLNERERVLLHRLLSDPSEFTDEFKAWLINYLTTHPPTLPYSSLAGAPPWQGAGSGGFAPTGAVLQYAGLTAPTDWLLCDGSSVSRTTYATLFGIIGTGYGAPDALTFNLPDLRGRVPVGKGTNATVNALGNSDGVAVANRRGTKHQHTAHQHGYTVPNAPVGAFAGGAGNAVNNTSVALTSPADGGSGIATDPVDGGAYVVVNFIIKT